MEGNIETFCWGKKEILVESDYLLVDRLYIHKGGYSSIHYHKHQTNLMICISGNLDLQYNHHVSGVPRIIGSLKSGYSSEVIQNYQVHKFLAVEDSVVIEIIRATNLNVKVSRDDIVRLSERGINK